MREIIIIFIVLFCIFGGEARDEAFAAIQEAFPATEQVTE